MTSFTSSVWVLVKAAVASASFSIVPVSPVLVVEKPSTAVSTTVYLAPAGRSAIVMDSPCFSVKVPPLEMVPVEEPL